MRFNITTTSITLIFLFMTGCCFGQKKFERESRIAKSELPEFAVNFASLFKDKQRIKWYLEEGLKHNSIEAKYKRNGKRYSVEFDTLGRQEDVEILIDLDDLPPRTLERIHGKLAEQSESFKIDKVQIQYTGTEQDLIRASLSGACSSSCVVRYELIVRFRKDKKLSSFEYLFSEEGVLEHRAEIIIQTSSNLEY